VCSANSLTANPQNNGLVAVTFAFPNSAEFAEFQYKSTIKVDIYQTVRQVLLPFSFSMLIVTSSQTIAAACTELGISNPHRFLMSFNGQVLEESGTGTWPATCWSNITDSLSKRGFAKMQQPVTVDIIPKVFPMASAKKRKGTDMQCFTAVNTVTDMALVKEILSEIVNEVCTIVHSRKSSRVYNYCNFLIKMIITDALFDIDVAHRTPGNQSMSTVLTLL
jgi:hypothetical protein